MKRIAPDCFQLINDAFESFLELTAIHGASHERAHIELQHALVHQRRRDIAFDDALGEAFHDGGLADTGFADQGGIILCAARQDLNDTFNFHLTADDGVKFFLFSLRG